MEIIKKIANELATNICELKMISIASVSEIIELKLKISLTDILKEKLTIEEREYIKLIELQSTQKIGSIEYIKTGYKLNALKNKKSAANRVLNELKSETKYKRAKTFIVDNYGLEKFIEITEA